MILNAPAPFILYIIPFIIMTILAYTPLRNALAPAHMGDSHSYLAQISRLILSVLTLTLPFSFDLHVPEVAGDLRWYMMHTAGGFLGVFMSWHLINKTKPIDAKKISIKWPIASHAALVIGILSVLTLFWSISPAMSLFSLKHMLAYILIFSAFIYFRDEKWYRNLLWIIAIGVGFNGLLGIFQFLNINDAKIAAFLPFVDSLYFVDHFKQSAPPAGTLANKNLTGSYLVITLPVVLYLLFTAKRIHTQTFAALCFALGSILLVYTRSRGSWVSAVIALIFMTLWLALNKDQRIALKNEATHSKLVLFLASIVTIVGFSQLETNLVKRKFHSIGNSVTEQVSSIFELSEGDMGARLSYNINGLAIIGENPLGTGLSTFHTIYPKYHNAIVDTPHYGYNLTARPRRAHNDLMQAFIELGVIGGFAYIALFLSMLIMSWKISRDPEIHKDSKLLSLCLTVGIAGMGVNLLGDFPLQMPMGPFVLWSFMGILTGLYLIHRHKSVKPLKFSIPLNKKYIFACFAFICATATVWVTHDNIQRREGTVYLKPAMGLSFSGINNDYALRYINKSYEIYPMNSRTLEMRAVIHAGHGTAKPHNIKVSEQQKADALLEHIAHDPYAQNSLINIVYKLMRSGQQNVERGNVQAATLNLHHAHKFAQRAVEVASREPNAYNAIGMTYYATNQLDEALEAYTTALKMNPKNQMALTGRKKTLERIAEQQKSSGRVYGVPNN